MVSSKAEKGGIKAGDEEMRKNWRKEPLLKFKGSRFEGCLQELDEYGNPVKKIYSESVFFDELYSEECWKDALFWYKKAALQNEPLAVQMLQCIADFKEAEKKAIAGDKDAQFRLSVYYHDSYGTKLDLYKSSDWLKTAAINGSEEAIECVNDWNLRTKNEQKLTDEDFYAEPGIVPDDYEYYYMLERHGRIKNEYIEKTRLTKLWEIINKLDFEKTKALAMNGNPEKQYQLAWLYDWGIGVKQDIIEAIKWFVEAAYNQYAPAQTELGIMYHYGIMATTYRLEVFDGKKRAPF